ncbi:MAG: L-2-amino-thiazoline-4-carboxylic acid hydrolase [Methylobacteriaceae bacterium]|nr:L-2-amino-thiazoline-4-carboxylic acid hydrolase [Methylobacteriaceae bacterium]
MSQPARVELPMIERRRIEANIIKHIYDTLKASHGVEVAQKTIGDAVRAAAVAQARQMAADVGGRTNMRTFVERQSAWTAEDALRFDVLRQTDEVYDFNVTRCRYAEMYRQMGLGEIGHLLSCQRDGSFCEGYDPRLKLTRTQTIMQGASHCDFRYRMTRDEPKA